MQGFPTLVLDAATATDFQVCALFADSTPFHDSATLSNNVHRSPLVHCFDDILPKSTFLNESGAKKRNFLFFARVGEATTYPIDGEQWRHPCSETAALQDGVEISCLARRL